MGIIDRIDRATLTVPVERMLQKPVILKEWGIIQLQKKGFLGGGAYRISGHGECPARIVPWSLILKTTPRSPETDNPLKLKYWKREFLLYQSGVLDGSQMYGFSAPRCFGIQEYESEVGVWLGNITDDLGLEWPMSQYRTVAYHLGQFNAEFSRKPLPTYSWVGREMTRKYAETLEPVMKSLQQNRQMFQFFVPSLLSRADLQHIFTLWGKGASSLKLSESFRGLFVIWTQIAAIFFR